MKNIACLLLLTASVVSGCTIDEDEPPVGSFGEINPKPVDTAGTAGTAGEGGSSGSGTGATGGSTAGTAGPSPAGNGGKAKVVYATVSDLLAKAPAGLVSLYNDLDANLMALGDDVTMTQRKFYFAYRRIKNFACVEVHPQSGELLVYVKVDPTETPSEDGFTRDVSNVGHYGTGDLEIRLHSSAQLDKAMPLLQQSYENS